MNIFYLDSDPRIAAQAHCDKHVVKMILETAQLLSIAHRILDGTEYIDASSGRKLRRWRMPDSDREELLYKATHVNHPCAIWVRANYANYSWAFSLFAELSKEYTHRYGRSHLSFDKLEHLLVFTPDHITKSKECTDVPQAMPDEFKVPGDPVLAYRRYYLGSKAEIAVWNNNRNPPEWWLE